MSGTQRWWLWLLVRKFNVTEGYPNIALPLWWFDWSTITVRTTIRLIPLTTNYGLIYNIPFNNSVGGEAQAKWFAYIIESVSGSVSVKYTSRKNWSGWFLITRVRWSHQLMDENKKNINYYTCGKYASRFWKYFKFITLLLHLLEDLSIISCGKFYYRYTSGTYSTCGSCCIKIILLHLLVQHPLAVLCLLCSHWIGLR